MRIAPGRLLVTLLLALSLAACATPPRLAAVATRVAAARPSVSSSATFTTASATPAVAATTAAPTAVTSVQVTTLEATASSATSSAAGDATATTATAETTDTAAATRTAVAASAPALAAAAQDAVKAVIQRANDEQAQAFAKSDDSVMRDTATSDYYDQLVQIARDMADGGVTAIKLLKLEWGPVSAQGTSGARATTFETWQTTYADGHSDQSRDRNLYTLVKEGSAWKIQDDAHPDANQIGPGAPGGDPGQPPIPTTPLGPGQSHNWSGYATTGGKFTTVTGTWTVPNVAAGSGFASDATWVGIGGVRTRDLLQAGTEATVTSVGRVRYEAWLELLPRTSRPVPLTVSAGDVVTVTITQQASGDWAIAFQNGTTGQRYDTTVTYASTLSSAEWVEEAPSGGRRVLPLDNFGTVHFANGSAVKDGKKKTIAQSGGLPVTMVDFRGQTLATPSALGSDGAGFSVSRAAVSPAGATSPAFATTPSPGGRGGLGQGN